MSLQPPTIRRLIPVVTGLLVVAGGCNDLTTIEAELTPEILQGDWEATSLTITNIGNPDEILDLLAEEGELAFRFTVEGEVTQFVTPPGAEEPVVTEGTYEIQEPFLIFVREGGEEEAWAYELQSTQTGNSLTLSTTDQGWDFDDDGEEEPALFAGVLIR